MIEMDIIEICKALSNETRLNILGWLKKPEENFPPQGGCLNEPVDLKGGVCVSSIQAKAGISQSTVSNYLDMLQRAGLLLSERHGKWTYYRRNEAVIKEFSEYIGGEL
ncbi:MAG TPA: transcriptional regulator [Ruminococcaceae bacterium]|nr:transcriptional regulator [Oscillospiraceae bacterium]